MEKQQEEVTTDDIVKKEKEAIANDKKAIVDNENGKNTEDTGGDGNTGGGGDDKDITKEEAIRRSDIAYAKAKRRTLEENLKPSIFGTNSTDIDFAGFNYNSSEFAGGYYGKAAKEGNWSKWSVPDDMAYKAFKQQGVGDLIVDTLAGASKLAVSGFLDMAGSWDLAEISKVASDSAMSDTDNWFQKQASKLRKSTQKNNTIYQDGHNMWNLPYWANQGQQFGYSVGIGAYTLAEQALLSVVTGGVGNELALASKGKFLSSLLKQGAMGLSGGIREAFMNARDTQGTVYSKYIAKHFSKEEAKKKADEAASTAFRTEAGALVVLNTLQNLFLFGGMRKVGAFNRAEAPQLQMGFSSFGEQVLEKILPETTSKLGRRAIQYGLIPAVSEGMEEGVQSVAADWGEYSVGDKKTKFDPFTYGFRDNFIGGGLGGIFLGAGAKALSMFNDHLGNNTFNKQYRNLIDSAQNRTANTFMQSEILKAKLKKAKKVYNKNKTQENLDTLNEIESAVKEAQHNLHLAIAINSLQHDYIKGKGTTAYNAHIGQMQSILDAVNNKDIEALKKFDLIDKNGKEKFEGSFQTIADTFGQNIKDSEFIKNSLENNLNNVTTDFQSAFDITRKEFVNSKHFQEISNIDAQLENTYSTSAYVQQLSEEGKRKFELENELSAIELVEKNKNSKALSQEDKNRKKEIKEQLKDLKYSEKDSRIVPNTNRQGIIQNVVKKIFLNNAIDTNNAELNSLKDASKISEKIKNRTKRKLRKAKTIDQVDQAKEEAEKSGVSDKPFEKEVKEKKAEIETKGKIEDLNKDGKTVTKPVNKESIKSKPVENSKAVDKETLSFAESLNSIKDAKSPVVPDDSVEHLAFSRRTNEKQASEEEVTRAKNILSRKDAEAGKAITLEDFIADSIERNGNKKTESIFNGLAKVFEIAGRDITSKDKVYDKYFNELDSLAESFLTPEEADTNVDVTEKQASKNTEVKDVFNLMGQPVPKQENPNSIDSRTSRATPKIAFYFQEYEREGNVFTVTSNELKGDNHFILDSKFVNTGDKLKIKVIDDENTKITSITSKGKVVKTTWGEYKKNLSSDSQAYINKIPMGIYKEVNGKDVLIGHVHDATWYTQRNITEKYGKENQEKIAKQGYLNTVEIRKSVLGNNGTLGIEVTKRQFGSVDKINNTKDNTPISLQKATGKTILARVNQDGNGNIFFETNKGVRLNVKLENDLTTENSRNTFRPGGVADVRYAYITPEGEDVYIALPILQKKSSATNKLKEDLDVEIFTSLKYSTLANIVLNNTDKPELLKKIEKEFSFTISDARGIHESIKNNLKVDIAEDLSDYLEFFVRMSYNNFILDNKEQLSLKDLQNNFNTNKFNEFFGENGKLLKTSFNVNYNKLNANTLKDVNIPTINSTGEVQNNHKGYNNLVKSKVYSNVRSHEITRHDGTKVWITDVQPVITYGPSNISETLNTSAEKAIADTLEEIKYADNLNIPEDVRSKLSSEDIELLQSLGRTMNQDNSYSSRRNLNEQELKDINSSISNGKTDLLTDLEFRELVDSLKNLFIAGLDFKSGLTIGDIKESLESLIKDKIDPIITNYQEKYEKFSQIPSLKEFAEELNTRINKLNSVKEQQEKIIGEKGVLTKELNKLFTLNLERNNIDENFSKSFLEKNIKLSYSDKLKMSFFGIEQLRDNSSQVKINDLTGLPMYENADYVELVLKGVTTEIPSSWDVLMGKLSNRYKDTKKPIYIQLKNKLENLPADLKNELLYKLISSKFTAHKIINSVQKTSEGEAYVLTVIDENGSKEIIQLKRQIRSNFIYNSPLTMVDINTNDRILNLEQAKKYKTSFDRLIKNDAFKDGYTKENLEKLKKIFKSIGINLSDNTLKQYLEFNNPLDTRRGILSYVNSQLNDLINKSSSKPAIVTDPGNNLFDNANKVLNELIDLEVVLNGTNIAKSIRVGGKTLQGVIQNTSATDTLREITEEDSKLLDKFLGISYSEKSLLLSQLKENPQLREVLKLSFSSPDSYKINGKRNYSDTGYDKLTDVDGLISSLGLYTNERGNVKLNNAGDIRQGLNFRVGQMPFMTLSDKGRMLYMKTILLDAKDSQIKINEETGDIELADPVMDLLFQQAFESEFNRILDAYSNKDPNIKSFSEASKIFTFLPIFNTLEIDGVNIHDIFKTRIEQQQALPDLNTFKEAAKEMLAGYINSEVNQKLNSKGEGFISDASLYENGKLKNIDTKYLSKFKGTQLEKGRKFFAEHSVNNLIHQISLYQTFLGDMAYYAKVNGILDENGFVKSSEIKEKYLDIAESIGQIVDKRAASLIAPGSNLANSSSSSNVNSKYVQLQMIDTESVSTVIEPLIRASKDKLTEEEENAFKTINSKTATSTEIDEAFSLLEKLNPELSDYFNMEGTDAQEYTTWKTHIDMLFRQGNLTTEQKESLTSVYNKMSEGKFDEVSKEEIKLVMQPVKPVYTGMVPVYNEDGKIASMRPVYIKSSAFPLLPQVTKNLKIDNLRKNLEALEEKKGMSVRASYQTANKIGANKTMLTTDDLYNKSFEEISTETRGDRNLLDSASIVLDTKNFRIQQETPDKVSTYLAKNKDNEISMGSQFWKGILGNGINKITDRVFPNKFSEDLLKSAGVEPNELLTGEELDKINLHVFENLSKDKAKLLYSRLGLESNTKFSDLSNTDKKRVLENIINILKEEISTRDYPEYLTEALNLVNDKNGNISLESPIFLDSNANKFESLLLSLVANSTIFHKLPGLGHISASSEGFEKVSNLEEISAEDREGIVWFNGHSGKLKSTVLEDGTIKESEVLIKSHYRITTVEDSKKVTKLVDLSSDTYSEPIMEDGKVVGRKLKLDMIDKELLNNFSFRIPTSSHQSGVILKVAGFLPSESGDMLVVPAEHTVQLGEDYDIDKRYVYKSNYDIKEDGKIERLEYRDNINDDEFTRLFNALLAGETEFTDKELKVRIKMFENAMIDIYKSVYQSPSKSVQQKIFKPLSVGVAEKTATAMDKKLNEDKQPYFSSLSDTYQRKLLKAGADGKGGIGVHSNAVTLEAEMQRLSSSDKMELRKEVPQGDSVILVPRTERIGPLESTATLGNLKSIDGKRDIADQHSENQNISTDNINEQIMIKRNENSYTMSVYALMASRGFDLSLDGVVQNDNQPMHIPSLFINQPIIRDYVEMKSQQDSISGKFVADKDSDILNKLLNKYGYKSSKRYPTLSNFMSKEEYNEATKMMTGQALYDSLSPEVASKNNLMQLAVLQKFAIFKNEANQLSEIQNLISLSTSGLGVSYFETLQKIGMLNNIPGSAVKNASKLIGDYEVAVTDKNGIEDPQSAKKLVEQGYTKVGIYYWKPTTIEGVMLIDSLVASQDLMDTLFPYKNDAIKETIFNILSEKDIDGSKPSKTTLEQKYEIMRELKSYMNTYANSQYFKGNINEERRRLFIDTETNTSLANIIQDIQNKKLPISNNPFIRNLVAHVKSITEPSLLLHNNTDNTSLDSFAEYDGFSRMFLDNTTVLGEYNGEQLTPQKLAQDLVSYAMLADSQNGATGFNTLIPVKYLQSIGFNTALNDNFDQAKINPKILDNFIEQYFQHNPGRTQILSNSTINPGDILAQNEGVQRRLNDLQTKKDNGGEINISSVLQDLKSFSLPENKFGNYVAIRNPDIKNSENKFNLFKYNPDTKLYEQIPTLGTTGMKEYNAEVFSQSSVLPVLKPITEVNKSNRYLDRSLQRHVSIPKIEAMLPASLGVKGILEKYLNSANTPKEIKEFVENLIKFGELDSKIVYTAPANGTLGQYNADTNEIYIHPNIFDILLSSNPNISEVRDVVREVILEEVIHSMTVKELNKYIKTYDKATGEITLIDNPPLFASKLVSLYSAAKETLPFDPNNKSTYYSKNIYEFMAGMFVAPDYREAIEKANPGIVKQFLDMLRNMFGNVYKVATGKTLSYNDETFNAVYDLLKARENKNNNVISENISNQSNKNPMQEIIEKENLSDKENKNQDSRERLPEIKNCK